MWCKHRQQLGGDVQFWDVVVIVGAFRDQILVGLQAPCSIPAQQRVRQLIQILMLYISTYEG